MTEKEPLAFKIEFPLEMTFDSRSAIRFSLGARRGLKFRSGLFLLVGDNGSGKTTFLNLLALTAGEVGPHRKKGPAGTVIFDGQSYRSPGFTAEKAAALREKHFAIFPQSVFFLPLSSRDNCRLLNRYRPEKALQYPARKHPRRLSGGQQQEMLLDMILDPSKPVWFLDEPTANLDLAHRRRFWQRLAEVLREPPRIVFLIDHNTTLSSMNTVLLATLEVTAVGRESGDSYHQARHRFQIVEIQSPAAFVRQQLAHLEPDGFQDRGRP